LISYLVLYLIFCFSTATVGTMFVTNKIWDRMKFKAPKSQYVANRKTLKCVMWCLYFVIAPLMLLIMTMPTQENLFITTVASTILENK
jgi:hypothetical protein